MATLGDGSGKRKVGYSTTSAEVSITSVSIFIAVCLGILTVVATPGQFAPAFNARSFSIGLLLLAIVMLLFANDFFILAILHDDHRLRFGLSGSACYSGGQALMILGICFAMKSSNLGFFSMALLITYVLAYMLFLFYRQRVVGGEPSQLFRNVVRLVILVFLILGGILLNLVRNG